MYLAAVANHQRDSPAQTLVEVAEAAEKADDQTATAAVRMAKVAARMGTAVVQMGMVAGRMVVEPAEQEVAVEVERMFAAGTVIAATLGIVVLQESG
jgi:hypothetical protein